MFRPKLYKASSQQFERALSPCTNKGTLRFGVSQIRSIGAQGLFSNYIEIFDRELETRRFFFRLLRWGILHCN